ncbi:MAG: hypothetical protein AAF368_01845, partial [Planctomycetota bacterium]
RRGGALLFSVITISIIAALAAASFQLTVATTRRQAGAVQQRTALYLAEAGLAESYAGLMQGRTGDVGSEEEPAAFGDGLFWVEATPRTDGTIQLESTGMVRGGVSMLSLVVRPGGISVAALGVFSSEPLDVPAGSTLDGYDSRLGAYTPGEGMSLGIEGRVGSNGDITIGGTPSKPTVIRGDVIAGPGAKLKLGPGAVVHGDSGNAYQGVSLPPAELPAMPDVRGAAVDGVVPVVPLPDGTVKDSLAVRAGSEVVLKGPGVFAFESLVVEDTASLRIDALDGRVSIFVSDRLELALGSLLETEAKSTLDVSLVVTGSPAMPCTLGASGEYHGAIYSPEASVNIGPDFEVFGALVAKELVFRGPAKIHVDQALASAAAEEWLPRVVSWRILEMADGMRVGGRIIEDPFEALGVTRATMTSPALAHPEQVLDIEYIDEAAVEQSYSGLESGFDWSDVDTLVTASRDGEPFVRPMDEPVLNPSPDVEEGTVAMDVASERLMVSVNDDDIKSKYLKEFLIDNAPVSDAVLLGAINRRVAMKTGDLTKVLEANPGAGDAVWVRALGAIERTKDWKIEKSFPDIAPSSPEVIDALVQRESEDSKFSDKDLQTVLDAQ